MSSCSYAQLRGQNGRTKIASSLEKDYIKTKEMFCTVPMFPLKFFEQYISVQKT